jgi:hypothetical protein
MSQPLPGRLQIVDLALRNAIFGALQRSKTSPSGKTSSCIVKRTA